MKGKKWKRKGKEVEKRSKWHYLQPVQIICKYHFVSVFEYFNFECKKKRGILGEYMYMYSHHIAVKTRLPTTPLG